MRTLALGVKERLDPSAPDVVCSYSYELCHLSWMVHIPDDRKLSLKQFLELKVPESSIPAYHLVLRYSDDDLADRSKAFRERAKIPAEWYAKLSSVFAENPRPPLRTVKSLLSEGEKLPYSMVCLGPLKLKVQEATRFVEEAQALLSRKALNRRQAGAKSGNGQDAQSDTAIKSPRQMQNLLDETVSLPVASPEIHQIRERAEEILHFSKTVEICLESPNKTVSDYEEMLNLGKSFNLALPEVHALEQIVGRIRWSEKVASIGNRALQLDEVEQLIADAERTDIGADHPLLKTLRVQKSLGDQVEDHARRILQSDYVHVEDLSRLHQECASHPVSRATTQRIQDLLHGHRAVTSQVEAMSANAEKPDIRDRPLYKDARKVIDDARILATRPPTFTLEKHVRMVEDWMRRGKRIFGKGNAPLYILKAHLTYIVRRNEACLSFDDKLETDMKYDAEAADGRQNGDEADKVFCFCRLPESGLMIECDICHEW